eukprot:m.152511 g.152511  ORF g.152511 m.152511 type:complete len:117 (+) comp38594_c0_seq4:1243-1593(+)
MGLYNINLGNIFMSCISSDNVDLEEYNSTAEAMKKAHSGDVWAVVAIPAKFSVDTVLRLSECSEASNETLQGSTIDISMDETDLQIVVVLKKAFKDAYNVRLYNRGNNGVAVRFLA